MNILLLIGIAIGVGFIGGKFANKFKFPKVVGYIIIGIFLGPSVFNIFNVDLIDKMQIFIDMALGVIVFSIGSELRIGLFKKMGKGIITIVLSASLLPFLLVAIGVYLLTNELYLALIFGALAPASAPAGTAIVLQEYKAKGPLTSAIYTVVGLDDGLAIIIYSFAIVWARILFTGENNVSTLSLLSGPLLEVMGAIFLGVFMGVVFGYIQKRIISRDELLITALAFIMICTGISNYFRLSIILSNLILGMTLVNISLKASRRTCQSLQNFVPPIYLLFFVLAGAHLEIHLLPKMGLLGLVYILTRTIGKIVGAYLGASISKADKVIKNYLGVGILSQAGVAIGLALLTAKEFGIMGEEGKSLAILVITTITATTIIFEIIGPIATKFAVTKAQEINKAKR